MVHPDFDRPVWPERYRCGASTRFSNATLIPMPILPNYSFAFGGTTVGIPRSRSATCGPTRKRRRPPARIPSTPCESPAMMFRSPTVKLMTTSRVEDFAAIQIAGVLHGDAAVPFGEWAVADQHVHDPESGQHNSWCSQLWDVKSGPAPCGPHAALSAEP